MGQKDNVVIVREGRILLGQDDRISE